MSLFYSITKYAQAFIKSQLPDVNVIKFFFYVRYFCKLSKMCCFLMFQKKSTEILYKEEFFNILEISKHVFKMFSP